ncbi:hypothetical protein HD553DRAFT_324205 [Filobasidium floriforme]|uniref:uncharacterized protein n=1 Tax=Filobasidium floriforme TaxID=5210 RepID=UPI001E8DA041|nr:uncharacterized protein HD553DRAFT_324205 [Filobasidium floriforme]KAH8084055.1 hypothetical protein HD553DRAFT_324205 [Filobasidium floriforme]
MAVMHLSAHESIIVIFLLDIPSTFTKVVGRFEHEKEVLSKTPASPMLVGLGNLLTRSSRGGQQQRRSGLTLLSKQVTSRDQDELQEGEKGYKVINKSATVMLSDRVPVPMLLSLKHDAIALCCSESKHNMPMGVLESLYNSLYSGSDHPTAHALIPTIPPNSHCRHCKHAEHAAEFPPGKYGCAYLIAVTNTAQTKTRKPTARNTKRTKTGKPISPKVDTLPIAFYSAFKVARFFIKREVNFQCAAAIFEAIDPIRTVTLRFAKMAQNLQARPNRQYQEDSKHEEESQDWDDSEDKEYSDEGFLGDGRILLDDRMAYHRVSRSKFLHCFYPQLCNVAQAKKISPWESLLWSPTFFYGSDVAQVHFPS